MFNFRHLIFGGTKPASSPLRPEDTVIPFFKHGRDPKCDPEIAHTIVELIEHVASGFEDSSWYWKTFSERIDLKRKKNYRAKVNPAHLDEAWRLLSPKPWLSLQNTNAQKKITTLEPLLGLNDVETLVLTENAISEISVLSGMTKLKELHLTSNRVRDLVTLQSCRALADLQVGGNPVETFAPLEVLPVLASLSISRDQLPALYRCKALPSLQRLEIRGEFKKGDPTPDFRRFPEMPQLRSLKTDGVRNLDGIERFSGLVDINLWGDKKGDAFGLDCLARLNGLMAATVCSYGELDVSPLAVCLRLRYLNLSAAVLAGLGALKRLPVLHQVLIGRETEHDNGEAESLRAGLSSWDAEFAADVPRPSPTFDLEIVSPEEFDRFDSREAFGVDPNGPNDALYWHEQEWLLSRIEDALEARLVKGEDFVVPMKNYGGRSHTLVIYSLKAYDSVRSIVAMVQAQLCASKKDWIIYFQALLDEGPDADDLPETAKNFIVWIYPEKIVATETDMAIVSKLLVP